MPELFCFYEFNSNFYSFRKYFWDGFTSLICQILISIMVLSWGYNFPDATGVISDLY